MTRRRTGDTFHTHIGSVSGPVHTGKGDIVIQRWEAGGVTAEEIEALQRLFADLRAQVGAEAPPELVQEAQAQVDALEQEAIAAKPDVDRMQRVRDWFLKHLPRVAGTVTSVLINPILGKVVEAAGDLAAEELRQRFGREEANAGSATP